jgi:minor histocompatibility antigen H13
MGESTIVENVVEQAAEQLGNILEKNATNGTEGEKFKATPEGLLLAYSSLVLMALLPIIIGSFKSVRHQKKQQVNYKRIFIL